MSEEEIKIAGLVIIETRKFKDSRGYFFESFNEEKYSELIGQPIHFVQDNVSISAKNVLRGLHFQTPPFAQGKLVSVIKGSVLDVAVDIRKNSKTYGKHQSIVLSAENGLQFWIPPGFAHGFLALEDDTVFSYKCTNYYNPESEDSLRWNDQDLAIDWKIKEPIISGKDEINKFFNIFVSNFN
jgi:dTDP-4-dehydrorhamnose 3,5-epimerase